MRNNGESDVDGYTKPCSTTNTPKNAKTTKYWQPKNTKTEIWSKWGPVFTFSLPGGQIAPLPPVSYTIGGVENKQIWHLEGWASFVTASHEVIRWKDKLCRRALLRVNLGCSCLTCKRNFAISVWGTLRASHIFHREDVFDFEKIDLSKYNKFIFSDQMCLRIIAESLKNEPVLLKS